MAAPLSSVIPVQKDSSCLQNEWTLLELNAELIVPIELPNNKENNPQTPIILSPDQVELGSLCFRDDNKPVMIIGSHELVGRIEHLKEPFCVFEKIYSEGGELEYKVVGVMKKKLLFNNYPKTIMKS
jgi:Ctf8